MKKLVLAAALGGTLLAGAAMAAQTAQPRAERHMNRLDTDNSGTISRAEMLAAAEARFAKRDANKDGQLSADEMSRKHMRARSRHHRGPRGHGGMFRHLDANSDGVVTRDEAQQQAATRAMKHFDRFDANKDGRIDRAEIAQHRAERKAKRQQRRAARQAASQSAGE